MDAVRSLVSVVEKLSDPLIQEASSLCGVGDEVESIKTELNWMQCFLKDADAKQEGDEGVKIWVRTVRDLAYDMEDIIDTFVLEIAPLRRQRGFKGSIKRYASFPKELIARHNLASEMKRIKSKIRSISERRLTYGIHGEGTSSSTRSSQAWRQTSPNVEEHDFVGFEKDLETLVARLIDMGEPRLCVVSVVGMGGLGKTTISRKVYNTDVIRRRFQLREWICVSQEYDVKDLLQAILRRCVVMSEDELKKVEIVELKDKISECLKQKRYLIVLDDVWRDGAWDGLKDAFPDMHNGSRVLLTTRDEQVALHADARSPPHKLRFLTEDESWDLFCKKSFLDQQGSHRAQDLQTLGQEIVKRCQGLPLAIVVIGGLLSTRMKEPREWEKVLNSITWQFAKGDQVQISKILSLSYKDLPYHLKPCFLYLGIFPEDFNFSAKHLIELWFAEGFLEQRGNATLEEVGEDCLMELIQRSLVQVAETSPVGPRIKSCRIHDLLRDLCILEAREDKFLEIHHDGNMNSPPAAGSARRLAFHHNDLPNYTSLNCSSRSHLRSMLLISKPRRSYHTEKKLMKSVCGGFKLLRVLNLHGVTMGYLPTEIGELIHLRYLRCKVTSRSLPSSIGNLGNLQILDVTFKVKYAIELHITSKIGNMRQLRHLRLKPHDGTFGVVIKGRPRLDEMSNLQTLTQIVATKWIRSCLGKLTNLRELGLFLKSADACKEVYESIVKMHCLESLLLTSCDPNGYATTMVDVAETMPAVAEIMPTLVPLTDLHKLSKLHLQVAIEKLPESCEFPTNLTKLTLQFCGLKQDPLQTLEKLQNLRILKLLDNSYVGKKMACSSQGFSLLESLHFNLLDDLEEWIIEEGALSSLLRLRIYSCEKLKMLPEGLQHMTALKKLELRTKAEEFVNKLRKDDGEDWHKIQNIPSIDIRQT